MFWYTLGMKLRPSLFWDTKVENIDLDKHAQYVIERVAEFGRDREARWVLEHYDTQTVRRAIEKSRSLRPRTRSLWTLLLK